MHSSPDDVPGAQVVPLSVQSSLATSCCNWNTSSSSIGSGSEIDGGGNEHNATSYFWCWPFFSSVFRVSPSWVDFSSWQEVSILHLQMVADWHLLTSRLVARRSALESSW